MALEIADRVKETTTTTSTGTYTLAGAVDGFQSFAAVGDGNTTYYACTDGTDYEVGVGSYTASGTTLSRVTILESSNNDAAVNWGAGTKEIFVTVPAEKYLVRDASGNVSLTGNLTVSGTVDGRDVSADGSKLDGIESGATADQTASEILTAIKTVDGSGSGLDADTLDGSHASAFAAASHNHDDRYFTETEADGRFLRSGQNNLQVIPNIGLFTNDGGGNLGIRFNADTGSGTNYSIEDGSAWEFQFNNDSTSGDFVIYRDVSISAANEQITWEEAFKLEGSNSEAYLYSNQIFHDGYHPNADKWTTSRTLSLSGGVTGSVSWDGSANATLTSTVALATASAVGGIKIGYTENGKNYPVELDGDGKAYVNVPWTDTNTDTNTTYSLKAQQTDGNNTNPNILLDASSGTDDTIQLVGGGATTITRNSDGQITISSTDTNTDTNTNQLTTFVVQDGDSTNVTISQGKYLKFAEGGAIDVNFTDTSTGSSGDPYDLTISHADTSSQASVDNSNGNVIQDVTLDGYGHVTALGSVNLDNRYTLKDHIRSIGTPAFTGGTNPNITTAQLVTEMENDGSFDSYSSVFKTSWSYAGNYNLSDAGGFTETAGTSWLTWTDNSSDSTRGNITALAIAPNTGGSAGGVFIYNDQGSSYSPGWREVWTSMTDGSGSGLDADLLDGQHGSYYYPASNPNGYTTNVGDITGVTAGDGLSGGGTSGTVTISHADTSTLSGTYGSTANGTKIDQITVDANGHVTAITTGATGSMSSFNVQANGGTQVAVSNGEELNFINGNATTVTVVNQNNPTVQFNHADTSSQASVNNSGRTYIQDITLDTYGHITGITSATETVTNTDTTYSAGSGLSLSGTTFSHSDTSSQASVNNSGRTYIQDITLDTYGHITGITSATETVTNTNQLTTFVLEDGDGTEVTISHGKEVKFVEGGNIDINWTDTSNGTDGDPYDLTFSVSSNPSFTDVYVADQIIHTGDTDTYMQFHAADQWRVVVGGTERLEVKNSSPHVLVTGDLNSTSDARLKENVEPIANALSDITQLEGVSFDWKDTGTRGHGFIAQQVEPILPDVVQTDDETGIKSINYVGMIGHLVEAIKEQQTQIDALTVQVEELKRQ